MGHEIGLASEMRLRRMEHKLKESEKNGFFFRNQCLSAEANPILESKETALITQGDKLFKVFSRPQIAMEDVMKFEKVKIYVEENEVDQNFRASGIKLSIRVLKRSETMQISLRD
jgi:tRNA uridine 5-carboxymethylaminomethyl modification enzyme